MSAEIINIMGKERVAPAGERAEPRRRYKTDVIICPTSSPELVALANALAAGVDRFNNSKPDEDGPNAITRANDKIWDKIEAFAPRSIADVLVKARAGEIYNGEDIPKEGEDMYSTDRIVVQMIADLKHLAGKGGGA